jgi:hypothetical protein
MAITGWGNFRPLSGATADGRWELCERGSGACGGPIRPGKAGNFLRGIIGLAGLRMRARISACVIWAGASRRNTGRILTERYRGFRATCNSPSPQRIAAQAV